MSHHVEIREGGALPGTPEDGLAAPLDCETLSLLRLFLAPILQDAEDWDRLLSGFHKKGYGIGLRDGRLLILNQAGDAVCHGSCLGVPLNVLMRRIGVPCYTVKRL